MKNGRPSDWTDERVDLLKKLWAEGKSGSQIAFELGGISRNSAIGKVHRLGLALRPEALSPMANNGAVVARRERRRTMPKAPPVARQFGVRAAPRSKPRPPTPEAKVVHTAEVIPLTSLSAHVCKWPIGTPGTAAFGFCGAHKETAGVYCAVHAKRARGPETALDAKALGRALRRYL